MPSRRAVLQTGGIALLGGCNGFSGTRSTSTPTGTETQTGVSTYDLHVENRLTEEEAGYLVNADRSLLFVQLTKVVDPDALEQEIVLEKRIRIEGGEERSLTGVLEIEADAPEYVLTAIIVSEENPDGQPHGETTIRRFKAGDAMLADGTVRLVIEKMHDFSGPAFRAAVLIEP